MKNRSGRVLCAQHAELSLNQYQNIIWKFTFVLQIQMHLWKIMANFETFIARSARLAHLACETQNEK